MSAAAGGPGARPQAAALDERAPGLGWARRTVYGGGGWSGAAWRGLARPLGWGWRVAARRRLAAAGGRLQRLSAPAISVGNVTVGGGGKTSLVGWILDRGLPQGARPAVLTRGYGRRGRGVWVLAPGDAPDRAVLAGDEPALLAFAGAWVGVGGDRGQAARALEVRMRPDLFLLDDALQHRRVARALDLVVFTADDLTAPARCLPAGPLRQDPGWRPPCGVWIVAGADPREREWPAGSIGAEFRRWWDELPGTPAEWTDAGTTSLASWRAGGADPFDPQGRRLIAFAGVARPASVMRFAGLAGFPVERTVAFRDHHAYAAPDIAALLDSYPGAAFVTTEKDAVKCEPAWFDDHPVGVLRRRLQPLDSELLRQLIVDAIDWSR